ncbi:MAG: GNAT family N-acetyltransferase [Acidimicrobiales bacterium]
MCDAAPSSLRVRAAEPHDLDAVISVCERSLGWRDPEFDRSLFLWKHLENAFGPSLMLVAELGETIVAVRTMMRWRFRDGAGEVRHAVRAVDTATAPEARGRGLFRSLTERAVEMLTDEGVHFVFNTPNEHSRPGYLRMGWVDAGRAPVGVRVSGISAVRRLARNRVAADKRSLVSDHGLDVDAIIDRVDLERLALRTGSDGLGTDHDRETLLWRYSQGPIEYRAHPIGDDGALIFRLRTRGALRELVVAERLGDVDAASERAAIREVITATGADHALSGAGTAGTSTIRRIGPRLTLRPLASANPDPDHLRWSMGDLELF